MKKIFVLFFISLLISGCNEQAEKVQSKFAEIAVTANPSHLYEGQETTIKIQLKKPQGQDEQIFWEIQDSTGGLAYNSEFVQLSGIDNIVAGAVEHEFKIYSLPESVESGSKNFVIVIRSSRDVTKLSLALRVMDAGLGALLSINSVTNNGVINLANQSTYSFGGLCYQEGENVNLQVSKGGVSASVDVPCTNNLWGAILDFSFLSDDGIIDVTASHNIGSSITTMRRTVMKDTTPPLVAITSPAISSTMTLMQSAAFVVSGMCSESTSAVNLYATSSGGAGSVTGSASCTSSSWSATLDLSSLSDGTITVNALHLDSASNPAFSSRAFTK